MSKASRYSTGNLPNPGQVWTLFLAMAVPEIEVLRMDG